MKYTEESIVEAEIVVLQTLSFSPAFDVLPEFTHETERKVNLIM